MGLPQGSKTVQHVDDEYFGDFYSDETILVEGIEPDDLLVNSSSANEELWDVLDISDDAWQDDYSYSG